MTEPAASRLSRHPHDSDLGVPVVTRRKLAPRRKAEPEQVGTRPQRAQGRRRNPSRFRLVAVTSFTLLFVALVLAAVWGGLFAGNPTAPSRLAAKPLSPTSVQLTWKGTKDTDKYIVHFGVDRALTSTADTITATLTKTTLKDLAASTPGSERYFRVDAYRGDKVASSRTGTFNLLPTRIRAFKVAKKSTVGVKLIWAPVQNARQYDVVIARDKAFTVRATAVRTLAGARTFVTDQLSPQKKYFVKIRPVNGSALGAFTAPLAFTTQAPATKFAIGTWNVCSEKCGGYAGRARIGAQLFNDKAIDIFGLQESGGKRVGATTNAIWSGGSRGFVRATGGAEARYIFYRPALFSQVSGGFFPVGDGRHATWAHMRTKTSKRDFFYVDVHLENGHGSDGRRAAEMRVLLSRMAQLNDSGLPIIYAGDFNSGVHRSSDSPGVMLRANGMVDTVNATKTDPVNADINSGHTFSTGVLRSGDYVDHIFVSTDMGVLGWEQLVRISNGRYTTPIVSDHNALKAVVSLAAPVGKVGAATPTTAVPRLDLTLR